MKRPLIVQAFVSVGWFVRCMVTGRMWLKDATGESHSERWSRSQVWAVHRPRWPLKWLRKTSCGCYKSPVTPRYAYYSADCTTHMPAAWFEPTGGAS